MGQSGMNVDIWKGRLGFQGLPFDVYVVYVLSLVL